MPCRSIITCGRRRVVNSSQQPDGSRTAGISRKGQPRSGRIPRIELARVESHGTGSERLLPEPEPYNNFDECQIADVLIHPNLCILVG